MLLGPQYIELATWTTCIALHCKGARGIFARRLGRYRTVTERSQRMGMSDQVCGGTIFAKLSVCGALVVFCCMQEGFESTGLCYG